MRVPAPGMALLHAAYERLVNAIHNEDALAQCRPPECFVPRSSSRIHAGVLKPRAVRIAGDAGRRHPGDGGRGNGH